MRHLSDIVRDDELKLSESFRAAAREGVSDAAFAAFMTELRAGLEVAAAGGGGAEPAAPERPSGEADPGATSTELDASAAARVFGELQRLVLRIAADERVEVVGVEHIALATAVTAAIARAADADERRHKDELYRIAHQLRNPLGSALMALTLLRSRADLGDNTRLADMLERNLKRLQGLIDESVGEGSAGA